MTLLDFARSRDPDDLRTLIEGVREGEVDEGTRERLRSLIEDEREETRQEAVDAQPLIADLEEALDLRPTLPPEQPAVTEEEFEEAIEVVDEDAEAAINKVQSLLQMRANRDFEFFDGIRRALATGNAVHTPHLSQDDVDALPEEEREQLEDRAESLVDRLVLEDLELEDFPELEDAVDSNPGRSTGYFRGVIRELRGEAEPNRVPAEVIEQTPQPIIEEAIEEAQANLERLQAEDEEPDTGDLLDVDRRDVSPGLPSGDPSLGVDTIIDEDYMDGTRLERDPEFEQRFMDLANRVGGIFRRLDFESGPDDYFALKPEHQREFYDATPEEWIERWVRGGRVTSEELRGLGFDDDVIPD